MAAGANGGSRDPDRHDIRSLLLGPGFRIAMGLGVGYIARQLWAKPQKLLDSKLAQLSAAPTISITSLKERRVPDEGELVIIKNGVVKPVNYAIRAHQYKQCRCGSRDWFNFDAVAVSRPPVPEQHLCRVPFVLTEPAFFKVPFVVVTNVDADHLPLTPVFRSQFDDGETRCLRSETQLDSVFGRLRVTNGIPEIEPCGEFPKKCFTMRRSEIEKAVRAQVGADPDATRVRRCGVGVGIVSLGLILSGFYSYAMD